MQADSVLVDTTGDGVFNLVVPMASDAVTAELEPESEPEPEPESESESEPEAAAEEADSSSEDEATLPQIVKIGKQAPEPDYATLRARMGDIDDGVSAWDAASKEADQSEEASSQSCACISHPK